MQVKELGAVVEVDDGGLVVARGGAQRQLVVWRAGQVHNARVGGRHGRGVGSGGRGARSDGGGAGERNALHLETWWCETLGRARTAELVNGSLVESELAVVRLEFSANANAVAVLLLMFPELGCR